VSSKSIFDFALSIRLLDGSLRARLFIALTSFTNSSLSSSDKWDDLITSKIPAIALSKLGLFVMESV
jgi:hypothetical protein